MYVRHKYVTVRHKYETDAEAQITYQSKDYECTVKRPRGVHDLASLEDEQTPEQAWFIAYQIVIMLDGTHDAADVPKKYIIHIGQQLQNNF